MTQTITQSTNYAVVRHQPDGELYIVRGLDAGHETWEAYGPLLHREIPATTDEADAILDNQASYQLEEDAAWLWSEHCAGRVAF